MANFDATTERAGRLRQGARSTTTATNATALDNAIDALDAETSTPLAETLFKLYTYFMSRTAADRPFGKDGTTRFPKYQYNLTDGANTATPPADPLGCPPQRRASAPARRTSSS